MPCRTLLCLAAALVLPAAALAQDGPRVVKLALTPAEPPTPALKIRLLPELRELRPGNAAVFYQRAHSPEWTGLLRRHPDVERWIDWLELPLGKVPFDRVESLLTGPMLKELDVAARMENIDWQLTDRIRREGPELHIPDIQGFRSYFPLISLRTRLALYRGKLDEAAYSLQTSFAMSRHLGDTPTLITFLVGVVSAHYALQQVEDFLQQPDAPNLYWALTDLPRPLLSLRRPLQGERLMVDSLFPEGVRQALDDPKSPPVPVPKLRASLERFASLDRAPGKRPDLALEVARIYPQAKQYFLDQGRTAEGLDALPVTQVVLMYILARHEEYSDASDKLRGLPYWQARPYLKELDPRRQSSPAHLYPGLLRELIFSRSVISLSQVRLERWVDALRVVEALRLHAAQHGGQWPDALADVRAVPIPNDPMTGRPFEYRKEGQTAILYAPPPAGDEAGSHNAMRYELKMIPRRP